MPLCSTYRADFATEQRISRPDVAGHQRIRRIGEHNFVSAIQRMERVPISWIQLHRAPRTEFKQKELADYVPGHSQAPVHSAVLST